MLLEFLKERRKGLLIGLGLVVFLLAYKYGTPEKYEASRYTVLMDIFIYFGLPTGVLWELFDFKKKGGK